MIRKADIILIASILALAIGLGAVMYFTRAGVASEGAPALEISVDGKISGTYSLSEDRVIEIGSGNKCEIKDGKVSMTWADCPDRTCVHTRPIGADGGTIICLPNRVVLRIVNGEGGDVDAVAQ